MYMYHTSEQSVPDCTTDYMCACACAKHRYYTLWYSIYVPTFGIEEKMSYCMIPPFQHSDSNSPLQRWNDTPLAVVSSGSSTVVWWLSVY